MDQLRWEYITSTDALRSIAAEWDSLWQRSGATLPTSRAALIAQWIEHFTPRAHVRAIVVRSSERIVAALPIVGLRHTCGLRLGYLPGNHWSPAGEALLDPQVDARSACDSIIQGLRELNWPLVELGSVILDQPGWRALFEAVERQQLKHVLRNRFRVPRVTLEENWPVYFGHRAGSHRRQIRRSLAKAEAAGPTALRNFEVVPPSEIAHWLRRGFELEDRGWKRAAGGSVLTWPGMFEFYQEQARLLANHEHLQLLFLEHHGRPIAFEYGWMSKGVYFSPKVAYDEEFARFSPGQLLRAAWLERLHSRASHAGMQCHTVDFLGPAVSATDRWANASYHVARGWIALGRLGALMLEGRERLRPLWKCLRSNALELEGVDVEEAALSSPAL